jgi:peroxiredoxin
MPTRQSIARLFHFLDPAYVVLVLGLVVMGWSNTQLLAQRRLLQRAVQENSPGLTGPKESQVGDVLPSFQVPTARGNVTSLTYDGSRRYVLLMFDPRCGVCAKEAPLWKTLASELATPEVAVQWVSLAPADLTRAGLKRDAIPVDPALFTDRGLQRAYRVASVPQVLVVGANGRVEWAHNGALSEQDLNSLKEAARPRRTVAQMH